MTRLVIRPGALLPVGTCIDINGQRFSVTAHQPYVRKDGQDSVVVVWQSRCLDCGEPIEERIWWGKWPDTRRCAAHKAPGRKAVVA